MNSSKQGIGLLAVMMACGLAGWYFARTTIPEKPAKEAAGDGPKKASPLHDPAPRASKTGERKAVFSRDSEALAVGANPNQRSLIFSDADALARFLAAAEGKGISVLGRIDQLNALHVSFLSLDELNALLDGSEEADYVYPVNLPTPRAQETQEGTVGIGNQLLAWLGITSDNSLFGDLVKIGVLDTGSTLEGMKNIFFVDAPENAADWNGHGTAVIDIIKQISPSSDIISARIANDNGESNTFLMTQGILAMIDAGVDVINISMGSYGDSTLLKSAVEAAQKAGIVLIASAGNEGYDQVSYPAAYENVVSVGAIDANGEILSFSNSGSVSVTAPGLDLMTAWTGGQSVYFTGTSASAPVIAGALAAAMSNGTSTNISATQAYRGLQASFNEAGAPGSDTLYGEGIIDLGRYMQSGTPGIVDAAIASNYISQLSNGSYQAEVIVENRGTTTLINAPVEITTSSGTTTVYVSTLQPGQTTSFKVPLNTTTGSATINSSVQVTNGAADSKSSNNVRSNVFTPSSTN